MRDPLISNKSPATAIAPMASIGLTPRLSAVRSAVSAGELTKRITPRKATKNATAFISTPVYGGPGSTFGRNWGHKWLHCGRDLMINRSYESHSHTILTLMYRRVVFSHLWTAMDHSHSNKYCNFGMIWLQSHISVRLWALSNLSHGQDKWQPFCINFVKISLVSFPLFPLSFMASSLRIKSTAEEKLKTDRNLFKDNCCMIPA